MSFHHTPQHSFRPVVEKAMHYLAINDGINWTQPNIDNWDASEKQPIRLQCTKTAHTTSMTKRNW